MPTNKRVGDASRKELLHTEHGHEIWDLYQSGIPVPR